MRKLSVLLLLLLFVFPAGCKKQAQTPAPAPSDSITAEDVDAFLKGENKELLEKFCEQ